MKSTYTSTAKALHWLIVALLIVQFLLAWTMPHIGRDTPLTMLINLHFSFGMLILFVVVVRLIWRVTHAEPEPEDSVPPWQHRSAQLVHRLLYLLLLVVPILGWINANWRDYPVTLFSLFQMPKIMATRAPGWQWTGDLHGLLANYAMLALVGLHVVGALYHYLIRRDQVLQRMLPGWPGKASSVR
ncbi:MAG: cytochrome b [Hyphomicrobiales bacterium]|nr:cytochrome b [Hyphomicrobiales bacterium]MDE2284130.1 cytochrome b [Hyphomicrobiales bacterium]